MSEFTLYIGYRHVSSWSLRAWMMMRKSGAPFIEEMIRYRLPDQKQRIVAASPTGKVPLLVHQRGEETIRVWESLAIGEYLAEVLPEARLWPADPAARSMARSVSCEMLSGFRPLRDKLSMDLLGRHEITIDEAPVKADIARVETIWTEARTNYGSGGPYLFGHFTVADAMFAPVATRFRTYGVKLTSFAQAYCEAMLDDPDMKAWEEQAWLDAPPEPLPG